MLARKSVRSDHEGEYAIEYAACRECTAYCMSASTRTCAARPAWTLVARKNETPCPRLASLISQLSSMCPAVTLLRTDTHSFLLPATLLPAALLDPTELRLEGLRGVFRVLDGRLAAVRARSIDACVLAASVLALLNCRRKSVVTVSRIGTCSTAYMHMYV